MIKNLWIGIVAIVLFVLLGIYGLLWFIVDGGLHWMVKRLSNYLRALRGKEPAFL